MLKSAIAIQTFVQEIQCEYECYKFKVKYILTLNLYTQFTGILDGSNCCEPWAVVVVLCSIVL